MRRSKTIFDQLDNLCFLSKNLYNATLYSVRKYFFETGKYLNYNEVNKDFTHSKQVDYVALPAKVSKMTQMLVDKNFKSFFGCIKSDKVSRGRVKVPNYLPKDGRQVVTYTKQALSFVKKGYIRLSKTDIYIKNTRDDIQFVRIVPNGDHIVLEIGYRVSVSDRRDSELIAGIDLGLNNLVTLVSNASEPLIVNGRPLKSINQFYNKELASRKSVLETFGRKNSNSLQRLHLKRNNKVKDYIHKTSREVVNHLVSNNITTLVVGYNRGWKQDINLSKKVNQNFVQVPFLMLVEQLRYKCNLEGISFHLQEESYTSKCSFFDGEDIKKHISYLGRRVKRGLFKTSSGRLVNADINAALNITKKFLTKKEAWNENLFSDFVEVSSRPLASAINL